MLKLTLLAGLWCGQMIGPPLPADSPASGMAPPASHAPPTLPTLDPPTEADYPVKAALPAASPSAAPDNSKWTSRTQPLMTREAAESQQTTPVTTTQQVAARVQEKKEDEKKSASPQEGLEVLPEPSQPKEETPEAPTAPQPDRWFLMKALQGSWPGAALIDNRMQIWGWTTMSFTPSSASVDNNLPVTWNDRSNQYLLNQHWTRIERTVVTSGTTSPTWGFRADILYGTDYRWTLPRGFLTPQLQNANGNVNLYGVDLIASYLEWYMPTFFNGLDVKVGRFFTPFGYESLETISSPLVSKSYSFNWFPPFTHYGILATTTFNPKWRAQLGVVNGNDVAWGNPGEEYRALATLTYTHPNLRDVVTFGTSIGRGAMNTGDPFNPATYGLQTEPAGRNNINVFDVVWTHVVNPRINYAMEADFGYQTNVPANVAGGIVDLGRPTGAPGTARWGGIVNYLLISLTPKLTQVTRIELWDDFNGQRTGFEGMYYAPTVGLVYKPYPWLWWRQELRYDYNGESTPFNNGTRHDLFTAGMDLTVRW